MNARGDAGRVIGWDIGGAHVKACLLEDGRARDAAQWPCRLWQGQDELDRAIEAVRERWPEAFAAAHHAVTMTGEMVDLFANRRDGVLRLVEQLATRLSAAPRLYAAGPRGGIWVAAADAAQHWQAIASANWLASAGVKAGVVSAENVLVYGLGGFNLLNEDLRINFGGPTTSSNKTIVGGSLGVGAAFRPALLQGWGRPISMFIEYQHTWWQDAHLNQPAASPLFNYTFRREDDSLRIGFAVHFGAPSAPPRTPPTTWGLPVKAPALK